MPVERQRTRDNERFESHDKNGSRNEATTPN